MTEQELRDKRFNIVSDYCFGRFDLDTMVDKIYSLAQETIEKQKKEIETYKLLYEDACDTSNAWKMRHEALCDFDPPELYLHLTSLESEIKAKDAEIESLKDAYSIVADANTEKLFELEKKDQAIAEAREIITKFLESSEYLNDWVKHEEKAKAWLESNK